MTTEKMITEKMITENVTTAKVVMSEELKAELTRLGWNAAAIEAYGLWEVRVPGSPYNITLLLPNGEERHYSGPLVAIVAVGQTAIVR